MTTDGLDFSNNSLLIGLIIFISALLIVGLVAGACAIKNKCKKEKPED
jgi:archaellum component FlaG (FlaF/FlaG flagellin family)